MKKSNQPLVVDEKGIRRFAEEIHEPDSLIWLDEESEALTVAMHLVMLAEEHGFDFEKFGKENAIYSGILTSWGSVKANLMQIANRHWERRRRLLDEDQANGGGAAAVIEEPEYGT